MIFYQCVMSPARFVVIALLSMVLTGYVSADSFSKFGIIRANIAKSIGDQRWLVCYEPEHGIVNGEVTKTEVVGFNNNGDFFRIRGHLRSGVDNLLSLESYDKPSVAFSTEEGYLYIWNTVDGENPFESLLNLKEYEKIIEKFDFYPLLVNSKDAPVKFELLKENPDFYSRVLALPRPQSRWQLKDPGAKWAKLGISFAEKPNNDRCLVQGVADEYVAKAAGLRPDDTIMSLAVDGNRVEMEKFFPLPDDKLIRLLSLKVMRKSDEDNISILDINIFLPSSFEYFLKR
jgi:hypothetical protein